MTTATVGGGFAITSRAHLRLRPYALGVATVITMTTLASEHQLYLFGSILLGLCLLLVKVAMRRGAETSIALRQPVILLCAAIATIVTAKAVVAVLTVATVPSGAITAETFVNRWGGNMLWLLLLGVLMTVFLNTSKATLRQAVRVVLAVHAAAFLAQFTIFHAFGYVLNFSGWLGGATAKTGYFAFFRPTGLFAEPSTFAGAMIVLLACDALVTGRLSRRMTLVVAVLNFLSLSTAAWLFGACLLLIVLLSAPKRKLFTTIAIIVFGCAIILPTQSDVVRAQVAKYSATAGIRADMMTYVITRAPAENIVGPRSNTVTPEFYARTTAVGGGGAHALAAISDDGTAMYLLVLYGLAGVAAYLWFLVYTYRRLTLPVFSVLLLSTVTKITPDTMLFAVLAAAVCVAVLKPAKAGTVGRRNPSKGHPS